MDPEQQQELADLLKALGEYNRLSLVYELCQCEKPQNAMCLCECCSVDASVASRHLKVLEDADLVVVQWQGREKKPFLNPLPIVEIERRWTAKFARARSDALLELKDRLESGEGQ